jgi:hypothetical protein
MEEMRQLISQRQGEGTPRSRPLSTAVDTPVRTSGLSRIDDIHRSLNTLVSEAEVGLTRASSNHQALEDGIQQLSEDLKDVRLPWFHSTSQFTPTVRQRSTELEKTRLELQNARRQCELVKSLLSDATAEKEIMYEVRSLWSLFLALS